LPYFDLRRTENPIKTLMLERFAKWWHYFKFLCNRRLYLEPGDRPRLVELLSRMKPYRAEGVPKRRIGTSRDGGYVMLDDFSTVKGAYSLGIGHDVSWDLEMARLGIPVLQFDYSIDKPPQDHPLFTFHQVRMSAVHDPKAGVENLASLLARYHPGETDLILKVDIEGSEWEIFAEMDAEVLKHFRQITVEFHHLSCISQEVWRERAMRALDHLTRHHLPIHVHGNCIAYLLVLQDIQIPDALELTFARRDTYKLVPTDETFPGPHDKSNSFLLPDAKLGNFRFS